MYNAILYFTREGVYHDAMEGASLQEIGRRFAEGDLSSVDIFNAQGETTAQLRWLDGASAVETCESDGAACMLYLGTDPEGFQYDCVLEEGTSNFKVQILEIGRDGDLITLQCVDSDGNREARAAWFTDEADAVRWIDTFWEGR